MIVTSGSTRDVSFRLQKTLTRTHLEQMVVVVGKWLRNIATSYSALIALRNNKFRYLILTV